MCGIFALLASDKICADDLKHLLECIDNRGPDYCSPLLDHVTYSGGPWLKLKSSVLHLRGDVCQRQPMIDMYGNILMFNGQIYKFCKSPIEEHRSDTTFLAGKLEACNEQEIVDTMTLIEGPFAFVYWHHKLRKLFYGRDLFGRKSLCVLKDTNDQSILIASVADERLETQDLKWHEVSCSGLHCVDFSEDGTVNEYTYLWDLDTVYPKTRKCKSIHHKTPTSNKLQIRYLDPLNSSETGPTGFDEITRIKTLKQLESRFIEAIASRYRHNKTACLKCRRIARENDIEECKCCHSRVAVAFSGGIDSTLIALALDKVVDKNETIDLITVAFKPNSPDRESVGCAFREIRSLSPDRTWRLILCDTTKEELQLERDKRIRNLILPCDSVFDDGIGCACWFIARGAGRSMISSVNDDWMHKNFETFLAYNPSPFPIYEPQIMLSYTCPASMLFVGSSIDEQLGGYSSHRSAWSKSGANGLFEEVSFLMRRLSSRNLGRDDRVYCDHGRDLKLPFLDYQFVSYLNGLPLGLKMNLDEPLDIGPKKILRELALKWGLNETARRVKRAMQFGTRIANLEGTKERGNDVCLRLKPRSVKEHRTLLES